MNKLHLTVAFALLLGVTVAFQDPESHPSEVSRVLATYSPTVAVPGGGATRAEVARRFLDALDEERRAECAHPLDSPERARWTNVPPGRSEGGVRLGDLSRDELKLACDLLRSVLSAGGYEKVRDILLADDRLLPGGRPRAGFGAENYWLVLFGRPSAEERWGLQLDGHHIAVNLTFEGEEVCLSPTFIGTQPSRYERGGRRVVPMREEAGRAFALVAALTDEQRSQAVQSAQRGRIAAGAGRDGHVPEPVGLACKTLDGEQRGKLRALLETYVGNLPEERARERLAELEREVDRMTFAWSGPTADPSDVSYRLLGPTVIIEYACQSLGGDPLDHLHSIYRDPTNEYGARLGD